ARATSRNVQLNATAQRDVEGVVMTKAATERRPEVAGASILDALDDPQLLGPAFPDRGSWTAWEAFLAALFGLPMSESHAALYRAHSGRQAPPHGPSREAWVVVGRRGGKSRVAALVAVYLACFRDYRRILAPGERGTLPIIAADRRQARTVLRYVLGLLEGC